MRGVPVPPAAALAEGTGAGGVPSRAALILSIAARAAEAGWDLAGLLQGNQEPRCYKMRKASWCPEVEMGYGNLWDRKRKGGKRSKRDRYKETRGKRN